MSEHVSVGSRIVPAASIQSIDCEEMVSKGKIRVTVDDRCIDLEGAEAIDLLMRTHPNFFEGKRMRMGFASKVLFRELPLASARLHQRDEIPMNPTPQKS